MMSTLYRQNIPSIITYGGQYRSYIYIIYIYITVDLYYIYIYILLHIKI